MIPPPNLTLNCLHVKRNKSSSWEFYYRRQTNLSCTPTGVLATSSYLCVFTSRLVGVLVTNTSLKYPFVLHQNSPKDPLKQYEEILA